MDKNLHDYRKSYEKGSLTEDTVLENPLEQFATWFVDAEKTPTVEEPNAMTLSTVDTQGVPKARVVLLKEFTQEGFVFYTNYTSGKAQAIAQNNKVCISFFWPSLERQIIITGMAVKISQEKSIAYFNKRPRESQLGAVVSDQSTSIDSREALEEKLLDLEKQYQTKPIVKPAHWGGYLIQPTSYEFWQGRSSRLHDRIKYTKINNSWNIGRLQP
ncbi:pyridoxamine 5'-phosphate oxidase [Flavobacteriaceae bacterium]|nr:pyridoxamine 5'-phosphate oxidase [Flavobacteriaceae bacterium]MDB9796473.1 pyridoxamine 5'-phosphate oxidase [Flavobacteriaceae bacterium]MDC1199245.1 pyridoxamine 5'-phosphate oxidase [Flavobacteriaceae bacterium]